MGSLIVKLNPQMEQNIEGKYHYSDIDMLNFRSSRRISDTSNDDTSSIEVYDVPMSYDVEAVKISVRNILMWKVGESILRPQFGNNLQLSMYQQMNEFNKDQICEEIKRAIQENEPRVRVDGVAVKKDDENPDSNALYVKVIYSVIFDQNLPEVKLTQESIIQGK